MAISRNIQTENGAKTPCPSAPDAVQDEDVEQVLEHVNSPFRWEILDVPLDQQKKTSRNRTKEQ